MLALSARVLSDEELEWVRGCTNRKLPSGKGFPPSPAVRFGNQLRDVRERAGLQQAALAAFLQEKVAYLKALEAGKREPPREPAFYQRLGAVPGITDTDLAHLLQATGYDPAWLAEIFQPEEAASAPPQAQPEIHVEYVKDQMGDGSLVKVNAAQYVLSLKEGLDPTVAEAIQSEAAEVAKETRDDPDFLEQMWLRNSMKVSLFRSSPDEYRRNLKRDQDVYLRNLHVAPGTYGIIWQQSTSQTVKSGEYPTSHTPDQRGDPSEAKGRKPSEHGFDKPSRRERRRASKKDVVFPGTRSHYDSEYLEENSEHVVGLVFEAAKSNDPDLSPAAEQVIQSIHLVAESVAKRKGSSLSKVSREHHISVSRLADFVRKGLIRPLYKDRGTTYLANETAEELGHDKKDAEEMGIQLAKLLRERREKYFPEEPSPTPGVAGTPQGVVFESGGAPEIRSRAQGSAPSYEVVTTLEEAAEKSGVPYDEILTTGDIEAEYHINRKLVHEYTRRGRGGQPHLTPLSVRLGGGGGSPQLLFRRGDVESKVANPPMTGRPPK
jgi:transcriptional regulator with XRE-family HTH domain